MHVPKKKIENYALAERSKRIKRIVSLLTQAKEKGKRIFLDKLVAELGIEYGLSERKMKEYLVQLQDAEWIKIYTEKDIDYIEIRGKDE